MFGSVAYIQALFSDGLDEVVKLEKFFMERSEFHTVNPVASFHLPHLRALDDAVVSLGLQRYPKTTSATKHTGAQYHESAFFFFFYVVKNR